MASGTVGSAGCRNMGRGFAQGMGAVMAAAAIGNGLLRVIPGRWLKGTLRGGMAPTAFQYCNDVVGILGQRSGSVVASAAHRRTGVTTVIRPRGQEPAGSVVASLAISRN